MQTLVRAQLFHTPQNPFSEPGALEYLPDGGVLIEGERIAALADYPALRRSHPNAVVADYRPGFVFPGFVDAHVHYPQVRMIGAMGLRLLEWLQSRALPEEARLAEPAYARLVAREFLDGLLRNGTTTALVFGAHFSGAQDILFAEAERRGMAVTSGMVLSDRNLRAELHQTPQNAYEESMDLIRRWHGRGRLRYAVTPRFALSTSQAMLEAAGALLEGLPDLLLQTHLNETRDEVREVLELFPWATDYLEVYENCGLVRQGAVFAHNLHADGGELSRLAAARAAVAHCPSSNAFLGSGLFPFRAHLGGGIQVALGSDVGGGTGFSLFKEGLQAYQGQMLHDDGYPLRPEHLLYLATKAGAEALLLGDEVGDLRPGKMADLVCMCPPPGGTLATVLAHSPSLEAALGSIFTLAREESVVQVYVAGRPMLDQGQVRAHAT